MSTKKMMVLDGSALLYRAYYALPDLKNIRGFPTNAIYGVITMVSKLMDEQHPEYICACFDLPEPTFRHIEFAEYKAQRKPTPEDLVVQIPVVKEALNAMGIRCLEKSGFEADDLMASLALLGEQEGLETYLVTGDKDILQLVRPGVYVLRITQNSTELYDAQKVTEKYGVDPRGLPDYLGLTGDSSDNIPGVPGVGEKTAKSLLMQYGSLESILKNIELIGNKRVRKALEENAELARKSRKLAILRENVPIPGQLQDYIRGKFDKETLRNLFIEYGFHRLLDQMGIEPLQPRHEISILDIPTQELKLKLPEAVSKIAIDLSPEDGMIYLYPGGDNGYRISPEDLILMLPYLKGKTFYGFELKPLFKKVLELNGKLDEGIIWKDLALAGHLIHAFTGTPVLKTLTMDYLQRDINPVSPNQENELDLRFPEEVLKEKALKIQAIYDLGLIFENKIEEEKLESLFTAVEMPLVMVLAEMESTGIKVDIPYLENLTGEMTQSIEMISREIYQLAGEEFNLNSPRQLSVILFDKMKLPVVKKTKTGFSTDVDVLEALSEEHPLPAKILEYRTLAKVQSTYVESYLQLAHRGTDTIHTTFQQMVANTGRIISSEPNLQNLPVFSHWGDKIRKGFIPRDPENVFLSADYSQIELRMLAHLSQDEGLAKAFREGKDIHTETAAYIFKTDIEQVSPEMRKAAKAVNFGIVYGMSSYGLSKSIKIPVDEAQAYIDAYFEKFPRVRIYMNGVLEEAREKGYVETILGRHCYIPDIQSSKSNLREAAERQAINAPVQGSAADLLKLAMIHLHRALVDQGLAGKLLLTIHDEVVLELPKSELQPTKLLVAENMESALSLSVPIKVDINIGSNLAEC